MSRLSRVVAVVVMALAVTFPGPSANADSRPCLDITGAESLSYTIPEVEPDPTPLDASDDVKLPEGKFKAVGLTLREPLCPDATLRVFLRGYEKETDRDTQSAVLTVQGSTPDNQKASFDLTHVFDWTFDSSKKVECVDVVAETSIDGRVFDRAPNKGALRRCDGDGGGGSTLFW